MKRLLLLGSVHLTAMVLCHGQWQTLDPGFSRNIRSLQYDVLRDRLYCFGAFETIGTLQANGAVYFEGNTWTAMGSGVVNPSAFPIVSSVMVGDSVFVSGFFTVIGGVPGTRYTAAWNGEEWASIGGSGSTGIAWGLRFVDGKVLACGAFSEMGGLACNSSAILDNGAWSTLCAYPPNSIDLSYTSGAVYNSEYYLGGNINGMPNLNEIGRVVNDTLVEFGGGIRGDSWVNDMKVFRDKLWVAGEFYTFSGNAASGLMTWDGNSWANPFPQVTFTGQVHDIVVEGERLFFSGRSTVPGYNDTYQLGVFDGTQLCLFGKNINAVLSPIALVAGNKLAVAPNTPDLVVNGVAIGLLATYDLNHEPDTCFTISIGMDEAHATTDTDLLLFPNPASTEVGLAFGQAWEHQGQADVLIHDALGRNVRTYSITPRMGQNTLLPLGELPKGIYLMRISNRLGTLDTTRSFLVQ